MHNPPHPRELILAMHREPYGLSRRSPDEHLDVSPYTLDRILKRQPSGVSPESALRLTKPPGRTPQSWSAMQNAYDWRHAGKTIKLDKVHKAEPTAAQSLLYPQSGY